MNRDAQVLTITKKELVRPDTRVFIIADGTVFYFHESSPKQLTVKHEGEEVYVYGTRSIGYACSQGNAIYAKSERSYHEDIIAQVTYVDEIEFLERYKRNGVSSTRKICVIKDRGFLH
ncbi:hypothetical protein PMAYCL1PPCAC_09104, partial [Pristionchus mayeri]